MFFKVLALVAIVAVANAGILAGGYGGHHGQDGGASYGGYDGGHDGGNGGYGGQASYGEHDDGSYQQEVDHKDYYSHPKYEYKYAIEDPKTGDYKSQHEHRDGDKVQGEYSFLDADGSFRKVQYTSDKHSGFQAIVTKDGHLVHPQPQQQHHY